MRLKVRRADLSIVVSSPTSEVARVARMIRIDLVWLAVDTLDMRAGFDTALDRVITVFGAPHPHRACLFANWRANCLQMLVHDGIVAWLAARRLSQGQFTWPCAVSEPKRHALMQGQLTDQVVGLPWLAIDATGTVTVTRQRIVTHPHQTPTWGQAATSAQVQVDYSPQRS